MKKKILIVSTTLMGAGILLSALAGSWTSVAVGSFTSAVFGYSYFRGRRGDRTAP